MCRHMTAAPATGTYDVPQIVMRDGCARDATTYDGGRPRFRPPGPTCEDGGSPFGADEPQEDTMGKTGRKRRGRKKKAANHGKRPNA